MADGKVIVDQYLSLAQSVAKPRAELTIRDAILQNANRHSEKIAITSDHENISKSFRQLFSDCCNLADNLVEICGLKYGDHVAIATGNCYNYLVAFLACAFKGLIVWHYDPNMAPEEVDRMVRTAKPAAIFTMGHMSPQHRCFPNMAAILVKLENMGVKVVSIDGRSYHRANCYHIDDLLKPSAKDSAADRAPAPSDNLLVMVTSGSTGVPKMVLWSHKNVINNAQLFCSNLGLSDRDILCLPVSVHHIYATIVLRTLLFSSHHTILTGYRYSLRQTVSCLTKYGCSYAALVPTMIHDILAQVVAKGLKLNLTDIFSGSAPLGQKMASTMTAILPNIKCHQIYGSSEMAIASIVTKTRFDTVGKPTDDCQVKLVDEAGQVVPLGQTGRLLVKTKLGMTGYLLPDGAVDASVYGEDGYFDTGDLFKMDAEGYLYCRGRVKDLINRAGVKVSPKEVEAAILSVAGVLDCVVVGIPDKRLGEESIAVVHIEDMSNLSGETLMELVADKISKTKWPKKVHIAREPLPKLTSLKHDKVALRAQMSAKYREY